MVTNILSNKKSASEGSIIFRADRPFDYYIEHVTTGTILYIGHYQG